VNVNASGKNILRSDEVNMNFATWTRMLMRELMDSSTPAGQPPLTTGFLVLITAFVNMMESFPSHGGSRVASVCFLSSQPYTV